ncbi:MAG: DUF2996 domain-containing protein [Symploca sp. SIO2G7]|nr:DUF2996 domain-containing protein [Symploca sp. SIO2G7]
MADESTSNASLEAKPATDQVKEPVAKTAEPAANNTAESTAKPTAENAAKPGKEPDKPAADKAAEPVAKADKSTATPAEKADKPAIDKATKPAAAAPTDKAKKPAADKATKPTKTPAKAKKTKPPKLEDKPFPEFIEEHFLPAVKTALANEEGLDDLQLSFETQPINVVGIDKEKYPQVIGRWAEGKRQFNIAFLEESIKGPKVFSFATDGATPSTIEQFMGDERRISLELMVLYIVRRLKGQKWLKGN